MFIELLTLAAAMLATGIETAFVPSDDGGGEYLVRVEPDLEAGVVARRNGCQRLEGWREHA